MATDEVALQDIVMGDSDSFAAHSTTTQSPSSFADRSPHAILEASYSQAPRQYPEPPTYQSYTCVSEQDTLTHYGGDGSPSETFRGRGRPKGSSCSVLGASSVLATALAGDDSDAALAAAMASRSWHDDGGPESTDSDDDVRTPDLSWSVDSGHRESSFRKRSPGDIPRELRPKVSAEGADERSRPTPSMRGQLPIVAIAGATDDAPSQRFVARGAAHRRGTLHALRSVEAANSSRRSG